VQHQQIHPKPLRKASLNAKVARLRIQSVTWATWHLPRNQGLLDYQGLADGATVDASEIPRPTT